MFPGKTIFGGVMDIVYIGLTLIFLALSWAFIVLCDRLMEDKV